jgi:hypothetical protein
MRVTGRWEAFFTVPDGEAPLATNSGGTDTPVALVAGAYTITTFCAHLQARLNAERTPANWTVTLSTGISATAVITIDCAGETFALNMSAELAALLGFAGDIASTDDPQIGTAQPPGLWMPDAALIVKTDPWRAPKRTDKRASRTPNGQVTTYVSSSHYQHSNLRYSPVPRARIFEGEAATPGASLEQWIADTQDGDGHPWFEVGAAFQIYASRLGVDRIVGYDLNAGAGPTNGWKFSPAMAPLEDIVARSSENYLGLWTLELGPIVSEG